RSHLHALVDFGQRPAGSVANEVDAVNYILATVKSIKKDSVPTINIETSIQNPTGSFCIDFLGGFASYYSNITNTVVRLSPVNGNTKDALLLNCHTDSVAGGPGASDDAVACSVLLEVMRAMSKSKEELKHSVIFLFNGAEENILQASHGFITQHPWAKQVRAFINLEAAGAGGKEIVFQTGPSNPWLALAWAQNAPHPFGSVVAQEIFQSGIIPSDTDFRIFRDYGHIPGIDLAYMKNGYVYHTVYDNEEMIKQGCIQRAGENILAVVRHLVTSPASLLSDPSSYKHGSLAFMDVLSLYMITIPMRLLYILNHLVALGAIFVLGRYLVEPLVLNNGKLLLQAVGVNIVSWIAGVIAVILVAMFLTSVGHPMSFYSKPVFVVFLYVPPVLAAMLSVHRYARNHLFKVWNFLFIFKGIKMQALEGNLVCQLSSNLKLTIKGQNIPPPIPAQQYVYLSIRKLLAHRARIFQLLHILWTVSLIQMNRSGILSSLVVLLCLLSLLILRSLLLGSFFKTTSEIFIILYTPMIISALLLTSLVSILAAVSPYGFPYAYSETDPTPKRLFLQHTAREFHGIDGTLVRKDSGIWTNCLDFPCFSYDIGSKAIQETPTKSCSGLFCHSPWGVPVHELVVKSRYVKAPPPTKQVLDKYPLTFKNSSTRVYTRRYTFRITGPDHMSLQLQMTAGRRLKNNSLTKASPLQGADYHYTEWYFIYYGSGLNPSEWNPWLELTVVEDASLPHPGGQNTAPRLEVALSGQYYSEERVIPVPGMTPELRDILSELHDWVTAMAWVSVYKNYLF
uniref:Endoplasmic reticulum metallopeptidase 1 n=1 Tax=Ciona savignyi TaxID=51511 RepID=H2YR33_CIOSA